MEPTQPGDGFEARPVFAEWLRRLSEESGNSFALDEQGCCILPFDGNVMIIVETPEQGSAFSLNAPVMPVPEDPDQRYGLMRRALQLNQAQALTRGGALALDGEGAVLLLCYLEDVNDFDRDSLEGLMGAVRLTVEEVRQAFGLSADLSGLADTRSDTPGIKV